MQKSDGIFKEKVLYAFEIAASGKEGESEHQLLQVQSPWERWVKGTSR